MKTETTSTSAETGDLDTTMARIESVLSQHNWSKIPDEPGKQRWIPTKKLFTDANYQRTAMSNHRVCAIAGEFTWMACGTILVAERDDGTLWVVDGQHRVAAAGRRPDVPELPCLVFRSLGVEFEANMFVRANTNRGAVKPYDRFRALLAASDPFAKRVDNLMQSEGYRASNSTGAAFTVACISAFECAMRAAPDTVARVWPLIASLHEGLAIKKSVFQALVYLARFGTDDICSPQWQKRVLKHGLHKISNEIDRAQSAYARAGQKLCAQATLEVINRGVPRPSRMQLDESMSDCDTDD